MRTWCLLSAYDARVPANQFKLALLMPANQVTELPPDDDGGTGGVMRAVAGDGTQLLAVG